MNSHCCYCPAPETAQGGPRRAPRFQRFRDAVKWVVPGAIFIVMPKCPACIAAYIALATGVGISLSTAAQLRMGALALCVAALVLLAAKRMARTRGTV